MPAAQRIRPNEVFTTVEWQALSKKQHWRGPALVLHAWGIIFAASALFVIIPNPLTFIIAIMLVGARQLGLAILMHEAAHGALHPNRQINDFLGHWLCAAPVGASLATYRAYHLGHHKYVQQPEDPDLILSAPFPVSRHSMRRKIIRDLTGQTFLRQRLAGLRKNTGTIGSAAQKQGEVLSSDRALRDHLLINFILLIGLTVLGVWWLYPALWLVAMASWFPLVTRIRNIAEHACVPNTDDPLAHARTTHASWWERLLIAPYWVQYHAEHHAFMHLPCYRLPAAHALLHKKGLATRIPQLASYWAVLLTATTQA